MGRFAELRVIGRLGLRNVSRVALYRLLLKCGRHPIQRLRADVAKGPFFRLSERRGELPPSSSAWNDAIWHFGWYRQPLPDGPPDWFANPFSGLPQPVASQDWWRIPDFGSGDIKGLWEMSRFDWAVAWATQAAHGDRSALDRLNAWLSDWAARNPPYKGPNWKCGQEASIRVMHLCLVAWLLGQDRMPASGLKDMLVCHLRRVAPTMSYAIGQANNHGTSEAAALFIGGTFLAGQHPQADVWARRGRRLLEDRAQRLIAPDGSFSQYSVNYHRLMLDTYSLAEAWRRQRGLPVFSKALHRRLAAAAAWLHAVTDPRSGDAPNLGANDGAHLMPLTDAGYRDFRPSVQLALTLFDGRRAYATGPWNDTLRWLGIPVPADLVAPPCRSFDWGGYHVLRRDGTCAVLRYPRFRFRPSQADALHLDLWHEGQNLLRDAGTFSYNAPGAEWFGGTGAHNTVEFDCRDQMPRLGRFLFGDWIEADEIEHVRTDKHGLTAAAGYTDRKGAHHHRRVTLAHDALVVRDRIGGRFGAACLRWRLAPDDYRLEGSTLQGSRFALNTKVEGTRPALHLTVAPESRFYWHRSDIPVLEITLDAPADVTTSIIF